MANCIGYEPLQVAGPIGPTAATVSGGVACAIFYLDPSAVSPVRWRPDGTNPTAQVGLQIMPGGHIVVAGNANIVRSRFTSTDSIAATLHCLYYDRVDVVAFSGAPGGQAPASLVSLRQEMLELQQLMLLELQRIRVGTSIIANTELAMERVD